MSQETRRRLALDELCHLWPIRHNNEYVRRCIRECFATLRATYPVGNLSLRARLYIQHCM